MSEFLFLRPWWFIAFIPLFLLIWLAWNKQNTSDNWKKVCDPKLLEYLIVGTETKKRSFRVWFLLLYGVLSIICLAGPAWEKLPQPVYRQQSSLILLFDLSKSMLAEDIKPSRLIRARLKILDILTQRNEGQTALIAYAGDAFIVSPLTDDTETISQLVPSLTPDIMPTPGSRIDLAITKALELFSQSGITNGDIVLITDEIPKLYESKVTDLLSGGNYKLSILSVGTTQGAPINLAKGGFLKDALGNIVIAKTNDVLLSKLASRNYGRFSKISVDDSDLQTLISKNSTDNRNSAQSDSEHDADIWQEQGPWLILLILPLVLFAFRRGVIFLFILFLLPLPEPVYAISWSSMWFTPDQRAKKLLDKGRNEESAEIFQSLEWQAVANYKAGFYEKAIELLEDKDSINANYNRGNSLAKLKRYEQAIKNYDAVLEQEPNHQDALYNKKIVEQQLKKQQNKNKKDNQGNKDNKDGKENKDSKGKNSKGNKGNQDGKDSNQHSSEKEKSDSEKQKKDDAGSQDSENNNKKSDESKKQAKKDNQQETEQPTESKQHDSDKKSKAQQQKLAQQSENKNKEQQQAVEQWLRKIPDDPAGLMRRKFRYQYQRSNNPQNSKGPAW